jgi:hypothetical protein
MTYLVRHLSGLAACCLIVLATSAQTASAGPQVKPYRPNVPSVPAPTNPLPSSRPPVNPQSPGTRPIGGDWWRIYPWSPYNAWKNPYWYPPYNKNYPYPPDQAYPFNPSGIYPYGPTPYIPSYPYRPMPYDPSYLYNSLLSNAGYREYPGPTMVPSGSPHAAAVPSEAALDWPLALRILPPGAETQALRQAIDARLAEAWRQATAGRADPSLVRALDRDVDRLGRLLAERADSLRTSRQAIDEAESFLVRLKDTIKTLP